MTIGTSLFLIAVGAILKFAVTASVAGVNLQIVGVILMVVGVVGLVLGLGMWISARNDVRRGARPAAAGRVLSRARRLRSVHERLQDDDQQRPTGRRRRPTAAPPARCRTCAGRRRSPHPTSWAMLIASATVTAVSSDHTPRSASTSAASGPNAACIIGQCQAAAARRRLHVYGRGSCMRSPIASDHTCASQKTSIVPPSAIVMLAIGDVADVERGDDPGRQDRAVDRRGEVAVGAAAPARRLRL